MNTWIWLSLLLVAFLFFLIVGLIQFFKKKQEDLTEGGPWWKKVGVVVATIFFVVPATSGIAIFQQILDWFIEWWLRKFPPKPLSCDPLSADQSQSPRWWF